MKPVEAIFYYKNDLYGLRSPSSLALPGFFPLLPMGSIRLVIASLYPCDQLQHVLNRIRPEG
jgi:hypothetical protein